MSRRRPAAAAKRSQWRSVPFSEPGYSLVELMACLSIASLVLTLSCQLIARTMRLSAAARGQAQAQLTAARLATQFRADVQQGKEARLDAGNGDIANAGLAAETLMIEGVGPRALEWKSKATVAERVRYLEDGRVHRERYVFPDDFQIELGLLDDPQRVVLSVIRGGDAVGGAPRVLRRFEGVLGRLPAATCEPEASP